MELSLKFRPRLCKVYCQRSTVHATQFKLGADVPDGNLLICMISEQLIPSRSAQWHKYLMLQTLSGVNKRILSIKCRLRKSSNQAEHRYHHPLRPHVQVCLHFSCLFNCLTPLHHVQDRMDRNFDFKPGADLRSIYAGRACWSRPANA